MVSFQEAVGLITRRITRTDLAINRARRWTAVHGQTLSTQLETQIRLGLKEGSVEVYPNGAVHFHEPKGGKSARFPKE